MRQVGQAARCRSDAEARSPAAGREHAPASQPLLNSMRKSVLQLLGRREEQQSKPMQPSCPQSSWQQVALRLAQQHQQRKKKKHQLQLLVSQAQAGV